MSFIFRIQRIALTALLMAPMLVCAQIPGMPLAEKKQVVADEKSEKKETIAIANIPLRAEEDERFITEAMQRSLIVDRHSKLAQDLNELKTSVNSLSTKTLNENIDDLQISRLESLERHWSFLSLELNQLQNRLQKVARPLSEDSAEISSRRSLWVNTRDESAENIAPALLSSIDELLFDLKKADDAISVPLTKLLSLSRDANIIQSRVDKNLSTVRKQIGIVDSELATIDADNIFEAYSKAGKDQIGTVGILQKGLNIEAQFGREFDRNAFKSQRAFHIFLLLLLPVFIWLSFSAKKVITDNHVLMPFRKTLTRPFSAWFLITIMSLLLLQLSGPLFRLRLLMLLAWLPVMRLQPKHIQESLGRWVYLTAIFYIINILGFLFSVDSLIFRTILLVNDVLMLATLAWLLYRSSYVIKAQKENQLWLMRILIISGIVVLLVAIFANIIGNITLAAMLTDAFLDSAYMGLFLFAVGHVVRAFSRFLLRNAADKLKSRTQHAGGLLDVAYKLFNFALVIAWLYGTLNVFRILRPLLALLQTISDFAIKFGTISITVGSVLLFFVSVYLSFWLAKTIRGVLSEDILPNMELPRGVANSVSTLSYYTLLLLGLMVALSAAGFQLSQLTIVLGALSVGIGFGLQTVVNNFVSGLILMVERPVQPGDTIELSGTVGRVRDIGMRATTLTTFEGADVIVPNGMLLSEKMINWTLSSDKRRIDIPVGVAYGNDPKIVLELLTQVVNKASGVSKNPEPSVLFTGFGPDSLLFSVRAWTENFDESVFVRSGIALNIYEALKNAEMQIPFSQRDLHIKSINPELFKHITRGEP